MEILKPPRLHKGDIIAIAAPGSPPKSSKALTRGIRYLEQLGYCVVVAKHVERRYGYLAGTDAQRAQDLNSLFANPRIKAIFTARGGYGSHRILPMLDYHVIRRNPKIVVGYSDITALQIALLAKAGLVTFSGPMVATEFGNDFGSAAEEWFWRCLTSPKPLGRLTNPGRKKPTALRRGTATGRLVGGNLSLVTSLLGTPYFPTPGRLLLFLEEVDEEPYRIDRMINHVYLAMGRQRVAGVVFGEFTDCVPASPAHSLSLSQVLHDGAVKFGVPALAGLHYGHVRDSLTIPVGVRAQLRAGDGMVEIVEAAVC